MKILYLILSFVFCCCLFWQSACAQETGSVKVKFKDSRQFQEVYEVLKSNKGIKHGVYTLYFNATAYDIELKKGDPQPVELIRQKGNFVNGKKEGEWITYAYPNVIESKGVYQDNKKTGIWETRKENGQVTERFDYTDNKKVAPVIRINAVYPREEEKAGVQGKVIVKFHVNSDCSIGQFSIEKGLSAACDQASLESMVKYNEFLKKYGPAEGCEAGEGKILIHFILPE